MIEFQAKGTAPYFTEYVRRIMEKEDDHLGVNIYRDGLKIYTTLDTRLQDIAEKSLMKSIRNNQDKLNKRLFNDEEEFSQLAYHGIYPIDTVKMMMEGDSILYEDLRNKLLVQGALLHWIPLLVPFWPWWGGGPIITINIIVRFRRNVNLVLYLSHLFMRRPLITAIL